MFDNKDLQLKDMLMQALRKWKAIAAVMILFAVLLPFAAYKRGGSLMPESSETAVISETEPQSVEVTAVNISTLADLYRDYDDVDEKIKKNEMLGIDPDDLKMAYVQYHIEVIPQGDETPNPASALTAYKLYYSGEDFVNGLLTATGSTVDPALYAPFVIMTVENTDFIIKVPCADDMDPDKLVGTVKELTESERVQLQSNLAHSLELVGEGFSNEKNTVISQEQKTLIAQKNTANNSITAITKSMTKEHIQYAKDLSEGKMSEEDLKTMLSKEDSDKKVDEQKKMGIKSLLLYALIGAVIGLAFMLFVLCEMYIFSGKLHTVKELSKNAGLFIAGVIELPKNNKTGLDIDRQISTVAASTKLLLGKNDTSGILLTSSMYDRLDQTIVNKLTSAIREQDIEVSFTGSIVHNQESLLECAQAGNIILVEKIGQSLLSDIENEILAANGYGINILGTIVVD